MWTNAALNQLVSVRNMLVQEPNVYDSYFNATDNIGCVLQVLWDISSPALSKMLYHSHTDYIQCNWNTILDNYYLDNLNWDLSSILDEALTIFTLAQLQEINFATVPDREYECFMSFLNGVIINNSELVYK